MSPPHLISIAPSHYCEKARWALERAGIAYTEERHAPILHVPAVKRAGGRRSTPTLVLTSPERRVLTDSTDILKWADANGPRAHGLYGTDPERAEAIAKLEDLFDEKLGPHTRRWAYGQILSNRAVSLASVSDRTPAWERITVSLTFPVARALLEKSLNITADGVARSAARIDQVFDEVAARLSDGRAYLEGPTFSAADLTFAALAAPVLLPPHGYDAVLPRIDQFPPAGRASIERWRAHRAGVFGLRLYAESRVQSLK